MSGTSGTASNGSRPVASVLIPVRNEASHIREAAAAMRSQQLDGELELLFVDGGSTDGTCPILEELAAADKRIKLLDNPAGTTPVALNLALARARGTYVVRMDAHSAYPPDYIATGIRHLEQGDADWVAGPMIPRPSGKWSRRVAAALASPLGQGGSKKWSRTAQGSDEEADLDTGVFCGVWRRELVEAYGGWDEGWPINQDAEMAARFLADGRRIACVPSMGAAYSPRDSLRGLARQYFRYGLYRARTARRHPRTLRPQHLASVGLVVLVPAAVILPGRLRCGPRGGLLAYVALLFATSLRAGRAPGPEPSDRLAMPLVYSVLHLGWGAGFLAGCLRWGPPWTALAHVLGRVGSRLAPRRRG